MHKFHPDGSLAPRDIAARAIYQTMLESGEPCVYLDITHKPADQLRERFPGIYAVCIERGIDLTREPIPVVPAAHYSCGGIATDDCGRTTVHRLRAAGVPAGKTANTGDVIGDQRLWDRELYRFVSDHREGQRPVLGPSWRLTRNPAKISQGAPDLGEDTDYVLHEILRTRSATGGRH